MRVLEYLSPRTARIVDAANPTAIGKQIVTRSRSCLVSAGTEMGFYRGTAPQLQNSIDEFRVFRSKANNITYPMRSDGPGVWWMGYSNVSEVIEVSREVTKFHPGDLVYAKAGHKSHQLLDSEQVLNLPKSVNPDHAAFLSLLEITLNATLDAGYRVLEDVVVIGLGPIGQLLSQLAKLSGCRVIAVDRVPSRLDLAKRTGVDDIVDVSKIDDLAVTLREMTGGRGPDVVVEASGNVKVLHEAIRSVCFNGRVVVVSFYQEPATTLELGKEFHHKRVKLISSQVGGIAPEISNAWNRERRLQASLSLVERLQLEPLISHRVSFEDLPDMLATIDKDPGSCNSVIVHYE